MVDRNAVERCFANFLGYGNPNGRYWFIGTEEGGAEIWRKGVAKLSLKESLDLRAGFSVAMDFRKVWEDTYGIKLDKFQGPSVWRYIAAFLLFSEGITVPSGSKQDIKNAVDEFVFKKKHLGSPRGDHFLCELFPLPKKAKNSIEPYSKIWPGGIKAYHSELLPKRIELIRRTILTNGRVKFLITYDRTVWEEMQRGADFRFVPERGIHLKSERLCKLSRIVVDGRELLFVRTPFFGNGRISYFDLAEVSRQLKAYGA